MCVLKIWLTSSTFTWAHNLFILLALGFLLWVVLCSETQVHTLVFANPSLYLIESLSFLSWFSHSFLKVFPPELPTPPLFTLSTYL